MNLYVTFGQVHRHVIGDEIFDKDCVAVIRCGSYGEGRRLAFDLFGDEFCTTYNEGAIMRDMPYYPRGFIDINIKRRENSAESEV